MSYSDAPQAISRRPRNLLILVASSLILVAVAFTPAAMAQSFDPDPAWPLCGRIGENPPAGWTVGQGCPPARFGNVDRTDFPLSDSYGPRVRFTSEIYDYHRGIDIPTVAQDLPVFAITDGRVISADGDLVEIRHLRPGKSFCAEGGGCYYSRYQHLSFDVVSAGQDVVKGQYLGLTGISPSGFPHLHFEIRDATPEDPNSSWQVDAIHPLRVLPYPDLRATGIDVEILSVDETDPTSPIVTARVVAPAGELDLVRVEAVIYEIKPDGSFVRVPQSGDVLNANGYFVKPPWLDFEERNALFSHKDNLEFPWSTFNNCPYVNQHGSGYDPNYHVDRRIFDGKTVTPQSIEAGDPYTVTVRIQALDGPAAGVPRCYAVEAYDLFGELARGHQGCDALFGLFKNGFEAGDLLDWSAVKP